MTQQGKGGKTPRTSDTTPKSKTKRTEVTDQEAAELVFQEIDSWLRFSVLLPIIAPYGLKLFRLFSSGSLIGKNLWDIVIETFKDGGLGIIGLLIAAEAAVKMIRFTGKRNKEEKNSKKDIKTLNGLTFWAILSIIAGSVIFSALSVPDEEASDVVIQGTTITSMIVCVVSIYVGIESIKITKGSE